MAHGVQLSSVAFPAKASVAARQGRHQVHINTRLVGAILFPFSARDTAMNRRHYLWGGILVAVGFVAGWSWRDPGALGQGDRALAQPATPIPGQDGKLRIIA